MAGLAVILVLGGTVEGRRLAEELDRRGVGHVLSLAGRTSSPSGAARVGGFGGVAGLRSFLEENAITTVVDATHPFAEGMTRNAADACAALGIRLIRVDRPGWAAHPHAADWTWVGDHTAAAAAVGRLGAQRVLLTVGKQHALDYSPALDDVEVLVRATEPPPGPLPAQWTLLLARGPFALDDERRLFAESRIDCLVTKNSGGAATAAKLTAAHEAGAAVVMIARPAPPEGAEIVPDAESALNLLAR
ncbi:MAG: cobalt-precorrin-6A reductase [Arachnia sp.]